jgi:hypothetical protein
MDPHRCGDRAGAAPQAKRWLRRLRRATAIVVAALLVAVLLLVLARALVHYTLAGSRWDAVEMGR